jgi:hypothetical protein
MARMIPLGDRTWTQRLTCEVCQATRDAFWYEIDRFDLVAVRQDGVWHFWAQCPQCQMVKDLPPENLPDYVRIETITR